MTHKALPNIIDLAATPSAGQVALDEKGCARYYSGKYWIRYYPEHAGDDLERTLVLVRAFEKRFQKAVDGGQEVSIDSSWVEGLKQKYEYTKSQRIAYKDQPDSWEFQSAATNERSAGGMLAVVLYHRMIHNIQNHIQYRILSSKKNVARFKSHKKQVAKELDSSFGDTLKGRDLPEKLTNAIEHDYSTVSALFQNVRRSSGAEDYDKVLEEMRGEPMNLYAATLLPAEKSAQKIAQFYKNRYFKISRCWDNIDSATAAVQELIESIPSLKKSHLPKTIEKISASAKVRCESMRSDKDFVTPSSELRAARDQIRSFSQFIQSRTATETSYLGQQVIPLVEKYCDLVYDIAHVRTPRDTSTNNLISEIKKARIDIPRVGAQRRISGLDLGT